MGSLAARFKLVRQGVVVLRDVVLPAQGAEVRHDQTTLRLDLDDSAFVLVSPALVFASPDDCAAWFPVGFHLGSEHVPLDLDRISQCRPHPRGRCGDVRFCGRNDPGHSSAPPANARCDRPLPCTAWSIPAGGALGPGRWERDQRPNAHATISGNSCLQNASPCEPTRSFMTTSAPASRSASAHRVAFFRKNGSCLPATRYTRGSKLGITAGGR